MTNMPTIIYKKATQTLNLLARKKDGKINKMKAIKLIFLADRLHLRKYGRPIVGDMYWAMKLCPVGSLTKNVAELSSISEDALAYARKYNQQPRRKRTGLLINGHIYDPDTEKERICEKSWY